MATAYKEENKLSVEQDARFISHGIYFLPWIGETYNQGFAERKLLVLGESHYQEWNGEIHELKQEITRNCIENEVKNRIQGGQGAPLWLNIEQALLNKKRVDGWVPGGEKIWYQIAFYNFVQTPVLSRSNPPSRAQFQDSWGAFRELVEEIRPDRIIVCGGRLWSKMPPTPHEDGSRSDLFLRSDIQAYCLRDGTPVWCLAIHHPSICFSWTRWHPVILAFLRDPADAARLPQAQ